LVKVKIIACAYYAKLRKDKGVAVDEIELDAEKGDIGEDREITE
jgi:hypothetical protein